MLFAELSFIEIVYPPAMAAGRFCPIVTAGLL